jgi:hypothetical protein
MTRKSVLFGVGGVALLLGSVASALALLVLHEPGFYTRSALPPGPVRKQHSKAFVAEFSHLFNGIYNLYPEWYGTFTDAQINSYLEEDFLASGNAEKVLPEGISAPRVVIEPDKIRLAFRYGSEPWSTIISIDLRVWLAPKEPNVVALELQGLHAGSLPISAQSLLEHISEVARRNNIDPTWYRHNGNPVVLLRFQSDQPRPTVQLRKLELHQGMLRVVGRSLAEPSLRAMNPPPDVKPSAN